MSPQSTSLSVIELRPHPQGVFASEYSADNLPSIGSRPSMDIARFTIDVPVRGRLARGLGLTSVVPSALRANWLSLQRAKLTASTKTRINQLAQLPDGWRGSGSKCLSAESLRTFLRLWEQVHPPSKEPFITLAPNGQVFLEWHKSWRKHLDVQCFPDDQVIFGLLEGTNEIGGKCDTSALLTLINARGGTALKWG